MGDILSKANGQAKDTKSIGERVKESVTESAERVARELKPDQDKTERAKDNSKHGCTHESVAHKIKDAFYPKHAATHTGEHVDAHITK